MHKTIIIIILTLFLNSTYGQENSSESKKDTLISFLNTKEFILIKKDLSKRNYRNLIKIWFSGIDKDLKPEFTMNSYSWSEPEEAYHQILFWNKLIIITYQLSAGSNTGTLIYDRLTKKIKEFKFYTETIKGNLLQITREGYDNNGHYWHEGELNLSNFHIKWNNTLH